MDFTHIFPALVGRIEEGGERRSLSNGEQKSYG